MLVEWGSLSECLALRIAGSRTLKDISIPRMIASEQGHGEASIAISTTRSEPVICRIEHISESLRRDLWVERFVPNSDVATIVANNGVAKP